MRPVDHAAHRRGEISVDPGDWPDADAQAIRAKVVNAARNCWLCASRASHSGAGSCWLALETRSDSSQPSESAAAWAYESKKLCEKDATISSSASAGVGGKQRGTECRVRDAMRVQSVPWPTVFSLCADIQALRSLSAEPRRTFVLINGGRGCPQR